MALRKPQHAAPELTKAQRQILQAQTISEDGPGAIARDFESLLRFIAAHEVPLTGVQQLPGLKLLPALNECLVHPLDMKLQRPQAKSYPHLIGLYMLLRASGLTRVETVGKQRLLRVDEAVLERWQRLNPTERYFTLLETWLVWAREVIIGERDTLITVAFRVSSFLRELPAKGLKIAGTPRESGVRYYPGLHNLALLEEFGLVQVRRGESGPDTAWRVEHVGFTPFGDALVAVLNNAEEGLSQDINDLLADLPGLVALFEGHTSITVPEATVSDVAEDEDAEPEEPSFGMWQPLFQPYFPEWRENLQLPELATEAGVYVFKVSLDKVWRRIAIPSQLTLDDLSYSILSAYNFDDDHLYEFRYRNRFGATVEAHHPFMDEGPYTTEVIIGRLPVRPGDAMTYIFDFGDYWRFQVELERIEPADKKMKQPRLLESHGKAPAQYPAWEVDE